ncbi:hypothetical protein [Nocardia sp. NPDC058480]|uniref:hypothetical protein n=1 Tax=Nocardia sp. NPDC058480 TaxID=3346522 RepID=UPI00365A167B
MSSNALEQNVFGTAVAILFYLVAIVLPMIVLVQIVVRSASRRKLRSGTSSALRQPEQHTGAGQPEPERSPPSPISRSTPNRPIGYVPPPSSGGGGSGFSTGSLF